MHKLTLATLMALTATLCHAQTCNSNIVRGAPDSRYQLLNGDTEVKDKQTGLIWQRCSLGQVWSGTTCTGTAATYNWANALQTAKNMGGDWRVPNIKELDSLVEEACYNAAINETFFPATQTRTRGYYWSSSPVPISGAWYVHFDYGYVSFDGKNDSLYVRLVRSSQ